MFWSLIRALNRPAFLPVPEVAISTLLGQMGQEMLLGGQKALPAKLSKAGFVFHDQDIGQALERIVGTEAQNSS
jgi:NAD dependent epimerase/dehydratase family enzyme